MKKQINFILLNTVFISLFFSISCSKFLDKNPISESTTDKIESKADLEALVAGAYNIYTGDYFQRNRIFLNDIRSGNNYAGGDYPGYFEAEKLDIKVNNNDIKDSWVDPYKLISRANLILENVDIITDPLLSLEDRNRIKGEALFLRGQGYFELVKSFGGVPILLKTTTSGTPSDNYTPRNSEQETYSQIITDLTEAAQLLPDFYATSSESKARATKGAANAYLARAYAQMPSKDWDKVKQYCDAVINSPAGYTLLTTYPPLFDGNNYNNSESILEPQLASPNLSWVINYFIGNDWRKFLVPSKDIVNAFDTSNFQDSRYATSILFATPSWTDEYWNLGGEKSGDGLIPFFYKLKKWDAGNTSDRIPLIRLADIMLLKAEALVMTSEFTEASQIVTQVRSRSILGASVTITSIEDVLKERRLELFGEGHFWHDLIRHGLAASHRDTVTYRNVLTGVNTQYKVEDRDLLLPIPLSEMDKNPALVQNPGY